MKLNAKKLKQLEKDSEILGPGVDLGPSRALTEDESSAIDNKAGLQMISLRLPVSTIEQVKALAAKEGLKYQPYLRRYIIKHAQEANSEKVKELDAHIREIVREELRKTGT